MNRLQFGPSARREHGGSVAGSRCGGVAGTSSYREQPFARLQMMGHISIEFS